MSNYYCSCDPAPIEPQFGKAVAKGALRNADILMCMQHSVFVVYFLRGVERHFEPVSYEAGWYDKRFSAGDRGEKTSIGEQACLGTHTP